MPDIANQYPGPLHVEVVDDAVLALGEITVLPAGLFCRDLAARGRTVTNGVDYWHLHGAPPDMDTDLNGIPCETVWPDAGDRPAQPPSRIPHGEP